MSAGFSKDQIASIAALAHLELEASELELFARQLGDIIGHANDVQRVDTTGIPPTASVTTRHPADRPDAVRPSLDRDLALAAAPDAAPGGDFFRVPRVIG